VRTVPRDRGSSLAAITADFCNTIGTELTSMAILRWSQERRVEWHYIAPGKPQQNAFAESFIGRLRDELLARGISTPRGGHWYANSVSNLLARAVSFNPTTRRLALSARPLQKPFACRDQFTATHQFDVGVYLRGDTERVRISVAAQHLPVIQPQCSAIK
jgi:transposase InsO family protein